MAVPLLLQDDVIPCSLFLLFSTKFVGVWRSPAALISLEFAER